MTTIRGGSQDSQEKRLSIPTELVSCFLSMTRVSLYEESRGIISGAFHKRTNLYVLSSVEEHDLAVEVLQRHNVPYTDVYTVSVSPEMNTATSQKLNQQIRALRKALLIHEVIVRDDFVRLCYELESWAALNSKDSDVLPEKFIGGTTTVRDWKELMNAVLPYTRNK